MRTGLVVLVLVALPCLASFAASGARAEEDGRGEAAPQEGAPVSDAEAAQLVKALKRVARKKKGTPVLEVLGRIGLRSHPQLHKPLLKLLGHYSAAVAMRAADILAVQKVEKEKERLKLLDGVWKAGWKGRDNAKRLAVRGRALLAVMELGGNHPLDARRRREVSDLWVWAVENPDRAWGTGLVDICAYVRETKDKHFCRLLAEQIDSPEVEDVDDPSNPPREWWKRRWELWEEVRAAARATLEDLTGETFKTTEAARTWFQAHQAEFGFRW